MFDQRKRFFQSRWFLFTVILLLGVGYWINRSVDPFDQTVPDELSTETNQPIGDDPIVQENTCITGNNEISNEQTPYYLSLSKSFKRFFKTLGDDDYGKQS